ncbi:Periplasmic copper-binding protein (NosD) [uncultured archaeon]|nr:Periplasmic copper-binding protein (NosD) [uncultured archaeon]
MVFQGFIHSDFSGQSMLSMRRVFLINLIAFDDQAHGIIRDSCIFQERFGLVQAGGRASVLIDNSTVGAIGLFFPAQNTIAINNLVPGYFEHWSVRENISGLDYDIVLNRTEIKDNPGYSGGFEMGWNIFVPSEININISGSVLNKLVISFRNENVSVSGLARRKPVDFGYRSIHLNNTVIQGQWGIFVTNGETHIEDSDGVWLWPVGSNRTFVNNTGINEFDPRQFTGSLILRNSSMTDGFEVYDNSSFSMKGTVHMNDTGPLFSAGSRMTRNYEVGLIDERNGMIMSNISLSLAKNGIPVWNGTTGTGGIANFDITFDINNYQDNWILSSTNNSIDFRKSVYATSSSPVFIMLEKSPDSDRLRSVVFVDCRRTGPGDGTKEAPYNSVQKGIDNAEGSYQVRVAPGTCSENVNLKDNIFLLGAGADNTTIEGNVFALGVSNARISGFTVVDMDTAGIHCYNSSLNITNNIIRDQPHNGIHSFNSSLTITNNVVTGNGHNGIFLINSSHAVIKNNILANNIYYGISGDGSSSAFIDYNDFWGNGNNGSSEGFPAGTHNLYLDPLFIAASLGNFRLQPVSPAASSGDPGSLYSNSDGSRNDMGAFGGSLFPPIPSPVETPVANVVSRYAGDDGIVQRNEAARAIMEYFTGIITKQEAIEVVMAYFT